MNLSLLFKRWEHAVWASRPGRAVVNYVRGMSLRGWLWLIFSGLMIMAIGFAVTMFYMQHHVAVKGADRTVMENTELERSLRLKENLNTISQEVAAKELNPRVVEKIRQSLGDLRGSENSSDGIEILQKTVAQFDALVDLVNHHGLPAARGARPGGAVPAIDYERLRAFEDLAATVESYISFKQNSIYRMAFEARSQQERTVRLAFFFLIIFVVALWAGALRVITIVTRPLSDMAVYIDNLSVEGGLVATTSLNFNMPEIRSVARSFESLLDRLRGYQAINLQRLLIEKRRADVIAASISDGIFLLRGDEVLYANRVGEKIFGLPTGMNWKGLILSRRVKAESEDDPMATQGVRAIYNAAHHTIPVEFELKGEGRRQYYLLESFPISDEIIERVEHSFDGPVEWLLDRWQANTLVVARDVTLVKESQDAKSHFIATLSHEVKTPVTSLTMATCLLKKAVEQFPNPTHRALIETCADDVDRLRVLIDDLLSVSRFDALTQRLEFKKVDLAKLLRQSVQHFQPQAFERGVEIITQFADRKPVLVPMDATKVSWALSNLIINALRHTPKGGRVEATLDLTAEEGCAVVRIRDHGPGIDRERQERIFDKFNPFYDIRVARTGTVGMGLAIAREIVSAHHGRIWVVSEPGMGSEFCFSLPLKEFVVEPGASGALTTGVEVKGENHGTTARS